MDLTNLHTLSTAEKLAVVRTSAGLQWLEERLLEGKSLRHIAYLLAIDPKTIYRWRKLPDLAEVIAQVKSSKIVTATSAVCEPREAAYRIIIAYTATSTYIKGHIHSEYEYENPQELWDSQYIQDYFKSWGITGDDYYADYLDSLRTKSVYHLSNYTIISYCKVSAKARIIPVLKKIKEV